MFFLRNLIRDNRNTLVAVSAASLLVAFSIPAHAFEMVENSPILNRAHDLLKAGKGEDALAIYEAYLAQNPNSLEARLEAGIIEERLGDFVSARTFLERAVALHPESARAEAELGHMFDLWSQSPLSNQQNYADRAKETLQLALNIDGDNVNALTSMGMFQLNHGDTVSAERNFEKAIQIDPHFTRAYDGLIEFYIKVNDLKRAKDLALQAVEQDSNDYLTYFDTAQLLADAEHPTEALQYAKQSETLDFGELPERDRFIAEQYEKLGQLNDALPYYDRLSKLMPNDAGIWQHLAQIYDSTGQKDEAVRLYQKAVSLDPKILEALVTKAYQLARSGQLNEAVNQWHTVLEIQPGHPQALQSLASIYYGESQVGRPPDHQALSADVSLFDQAFKSPLTPSLELSRAKLQAALNGGITPDIMGRLQALATGNDDETAGEAAFLANDLKTTQTRLDTVDGLSATDYAALGDGLFLDGEMRFAKVFYQRAMDFDPSINAQALIQKIQIRTTMSDQKINEGNALCMQKQFQEGVIRYQDAIHLNPESDTAWLRLADTDERLKQPDSAYLAYEKATELNPALLDSQAFAKKFAKLKERYEHDQQHPPRQAQPKAPANPSSPAGDINPE